MTHDIHRAAIWIEDELDKRIGTRLKACRQAVGLSIEDLAAKTGIPATSLHDHETGLTAITAGRLVMLCQVLREDPAVLFQSLPEISALDPWSNRKTE